MRLLVAALLGAALSGGAAEDSVRVPAHVSQAVRQLRGGTSIRTTLGAVQLPAEAAGKAEQLMGALGLRTALDLQLLASAPAEAEELMSELSDGGLVLGHRAKVRVLLGAASTDPRQLPTADAAGAERGAPSSERRYLQDVERSGGLSNDTARSPY
eukprot:SAG31_NODE_10497_length_1131_cov_2.211240_2_plen_156_part_00